MTRAALPNARGSARAGRLVAGAALGTCLLTGGALGAQPADSLRLPALRAAALSTDPRLRQLALDASQSALRQRNLDAEWLPALSVDGLAQYQSEVARIPLQVAGLRVPTPAHDTYDAHVSAQLSLLDPTRAPRRAAERATLAESDARVRTTLYATRQEVDDAFFAAALLQARGAEVAAAIAGLDARRRDAAARVREGAALPSDSAAVAAALLQRRQDALQLDADRRAALTRLTELTGLTPPGDAMLALPDAATLAADVARARTALDAPTESLRARPEFAQLAATRERLARQAEVASARERPRVSAFARGGYGRPGLNPLATDFSPYWLGGVQVQWTPWTWGAAARDREVLALQQQITATEEAALAAQLRRGVAGDLATIDRLAATLALDDGIVALRERIAAETRARLDERVVPAMEYVERDADLLAARLARAEHRVALAQASARILTTLGLEIR
ncbi:MAG: TolC family protein [Gemmatirosa sp.]|nr:TolC family protein [Gemmatirosa sp.]